MYGGVRRAGQIYARGGEEQPCGQQLQGVGVSGVSVLYSAGMGSSSDPVRWPGREQDLRSGRCCSRYIKAWDGSVIALSGRR